MDKPILLESAFNSLSNNMFHQFSEEIVEEVGLPIGKRVFPMWQDWLMQQIKKRKF